MRALFFLVLSTLCHSAVYAWLMESFPRARARKRLVLAVFAVLVILVPLGRVVIYRVDSGLARVVTAFAMAELLVVMLALVPLLLVRFAGVGFRRMAKETAADVAVPSTPLAPSPPLAVPTEPSVTRRQAIERVAGLAVLGSSTATISYGALHARLDFQIEEVVVRIPGLPRALEGYTIAQVSDIHVGLFVQERELRKGLALIARTKPDLVVATGDLVDFDAKYIPLMARSLGDLRARDGVAAILGNHDYYTDGDDVREGLLRAGVRALVNQHVVLRPNDGGGIVLGGVDDFAGARFGGEGPNLAKTMAGAPDAPRILLAHQPQYFSESRGQVALQLSGHVHGGQINPIVHPARWVLDYVAGRYESNGSTMWVNRGFGTAGPPARLGSAPEITRIVLIAG